MELQDSILKDFADAVNNNALTQPSDSNHIYATVSRVVEDDLVYVVLNGAEIETPAKSLVKVGTGDVVLATMNGHTLTIIGNISYPALTRIENVYMTLTAEGLLIGELDDENHPVKSYIVVGTTGSKIYTIDELGNGILVASFGESVQIGKSTGSHISITPDGGFVILNGSSKVLAQFTSNGITLNDSNGNEIASFSPTSISIGQLTSATVSFCAGKATISLDGTTLKISGGSNVGAIGISNTYGNYKAEVICEAKSNSHRVSMQLLGANNATISSIVLSDSGVNVSAPNGALTEDGKEVVKVNDILAFGHIKVRGTVSRASTSDIGVTTPGYALIASPVNGIPTGYTFCGVSGISNDQEAWVIPTHWTELTINGKPGLQFAFINFNHQPKTINVRVTWFAVRTSGATVAPDQTIDF